MGRPLSAFPFEDRDDDDLDDLWCGVRWALLFSAPLWLLIIWWVRRR